VLRISLLAGLCVLVGTWQESQAAPAPKEFQPLRVLLLAAAPTREFQFLRSLLVREQEKKRIDVRVYLQGKAKQNKKANHPVDVGQLGSFPEKLKAKDDKLDDKYTALGTFDVLIAIDPDWSDLTKEQRELIVEWVNQGGGLIVIAGPIHTFHLARSGAKDSLKMIEALYPVKLDDVRLLDKDRETQKAWRLHFGKVTKEMTFLKLDPEAVGLLAGWEEFFTGEKKAEKDKALLHGFYTIYPVKSVKPEATVLATFSDPAAAISDKEEQPFLVAWAHNKGQVFYISSGEIWRLRQSREAFYNRFWIELIRFVSHGAGAVKKER
jgi:hypothetical protein